MRFLYSILIGFYSLVIRIAALFNEKAKLWINGRKDVWRQLPNNESNVIWFHAASLGEFEQGRSLIENWKLHFPDDKILLTFFSPSGYEIRKNYEFADWVTYLPTDSIRNAKRFIKQVNPQKAFFIKYEFWFNYLKELNNKSTPTYFVSSVFRSDAYFFKPIGKWSLNHLKAVTHIFVQDEESKTNLNSACISNCSVTGDTRIDRAFQLSKSPDQNEKIKSAITRKVIIAGSPWETEIEFLSEYYSSNSNWQMIIAPHDISEKFVAFVESKFKNAIRYSEFENQTNSDFEVLIIDKIGLLSSLYQYADIAIIGGGFKASIHNTLEPACFGLPVAFGPNYKMFNEASKMIELKAAFSFSNLSEFLKIMKDLEDESLRKSIALKQKNFIEENANATTLIFDFLQN